MLFKILKKIRYYLTKIKAGIFNLTMPCLFGSSYSVTWITNKKYPVKSNGQTPSSIKNNGLALAAPYTVPNNKFTFGVPVHKLSSFFLGKNFVYFYGIGYVSITLYTNIDFSHYFNFSHSLSDFSGFFNHSSNSNNINYPNLSNDFADRLVNNIMTKYYNNSVPSNPGITNTLDNTNISSDNLKINKIGSWGFYEDIFNYYKMKGYFNYGDIPYNNMSKLIYSDFLKIGGISAAGSFLKHYAGELSISKYIHNTKTNYINFIPSNRSVQIYMAEPPRYPSYAGKQVASSEFSSSINNLFARRQEIQYNINTLHSLGLDYTMFQQQLQEINNILSSYNLAHYDVSPFLENTVSNQSNIQNVYEQTRNFNFLGQEARTNSFSNYDYSGFSAPNMNNHPAETSSYNTAGQPSRLQEQSTINNINSSSLLSTSNYYPVTQPNLLASHPSLLPSESMTNNPSYSSSHVNITEQAGAAPPALPKGPVISVRTDILTLDQARSMSNKTWKSVSESMYSPELVTSENLNSLADLIESRSRDLLNRYPDRRINFEDLDLNPKRFSTPRANWKKDVPEFYKERCLFFTFLINTDFFWNFPRARWTYIDSSSNIKFIQITQSLIEALRNWKN